MENLIFPIGFYMLLPSENIVAERFDFQVCFYKFRIIIFAVNDLSKIPTFSTSTEINVCRILDERERKSWLGLTSQIT